MDSFFKLRESDQRHQNWLTRPDIESELFDVFVPYFESVCRHGRFFDAVVENGIPSDVKLKVRKGTDAFLSEDRFPCFSSRFVDILRANDVAGFRTIEFPHDPFFVIVPESVSLDVEKADLPLRYECKCGRNFYSGMISADSISVPDQLRVNSIFTTNPLQSLTGLFCTSDVKAIFKNEKLRGLQFVKVPPSA